MKYGLMMVAETDNIGDDVQSYAASRFLPQIDCYIDREKMDTFESEEPVAVIMNAWYMYNKYSWPPAPSIVPLLIAMHFSKNDYLGIGTKFLDGLGGDYLRNHGIVGARDIETKKILDEKNIESYVSGCLTLTLDRFEGVESSNTIYFVDVDIETETVLRQKYSEEKIENITHYVEYFKQNKNYEERLDDVEELLKKYQGAKCVVTSRLHCALPCLALGTPVLLVYKDEYHDRMSSFLPFLHSTTVEQIEQGLEQYDLSKPPENKEKHLEIRKELKRKCKEFVQKVNDKQYIIPERNLYSQLIWQKRLLTESKSTFRQTIWEEINWIKELETGKRWLEGQNKELTEDKEWLEGQYNALQEQEKKDVSVIDELKKWIGQLESGKEWIENQNKELQDQNKRLQDKIAILEGQYKEIEDKINELKKSAVARKIIEKKELSL